MSKKENTMLGLTEQIGQVKKIVELQMDFTLPPPIYGFWVTTQPEKTNRQIKLVKSLEHHHHGIEVESVEGNKYVIAHSSVKYYVEE
jgi:hypothetical protein